MEVMLARERSDEIFGDYNAYLRYATLERQRVSGLARRWPSRSRLASRLWITI